VLSWFRKDLTCTGAVLFRGPLPPRSEELDGLALAGIEARRVAPAGDEHWRLELRHAVWGRADVFCPRAAPLPPTELIDWDPRLSRQEKDEVRAYGSAVWVRAEPQAHDILRDRKALLRFLAAVMGSHGLLAMDHVAQSCWSRAALLDELSHDAALDISALFTIHMLEDDDREVFWLHSHGLKEIGFCDFDMIEPHASSYREGYDALRALAFCIVEGQLAAGGGAFDLVHPGGSIQLVSARRFLGQAAGDEWRRWRANVDDEHLEGHAIVCDRLRRPWFGLRGSTPRPSRLFAGQFPTGGVIQFSSSASALMGERARNTYEAFRALLDELAEFSLPALVKLGYRVDGGGESDHEHLWFEVHACRAGEIDGTLVNHPLYIARLKMGERAVHSADLISDWTILSPFGSITPRFGMALREVRSRPDELRRMLAEAGRGS
jgi:hypothetical protein